MERLVVAVTLFGALLLVIGAVSAVSPMTQLGIRTRGKAFILLAVGLVLFISGPVLQTLTTTFPPPARQQPGPIERGRAHDDDPETRLCRLVEELFQGQTNVSHRSRLRKCSVRKRNETYGVAVAFNADDRLTASMTREGIEEAMRRAYEVLYSSGMPLHEVSIAAYLTFPGPSGSLEDVRVFETRLDRERDAGRRGNRDEAPAIESMWNVTTLHPDLK